MTPSKNQLAAATAVTGSVLLVIGLWTQSRLGASLLPYASCITASPSLLWLHLVSDALIALAYVAIPWSIFLIIRRRPDIPFGWMAWLFCAFILACGLTHAMAAWTMWEPVYWYSGVTKAFTALVSLFTAWMLYRLTPHALALPLATPAGEGHSTLQQEIASRRQAEADLSRAKGELEVMLGRMTAKAQREAAVLDRFFEVAPLGLGVLDGDTRIVRVNPAMPHASHRRTEDLIGRRLEQVEEVPGDAVSAAKAVARDRQARVRLNVSGRDADTGEPRHSLTSYFPIELPDGTFLIGCVVEDITYQRQVERQLEGAVRAAEQANRARDEFLARVSHELRSPLQVALSSTEVLKRVPNLPETVAKVTDRLAHAIRMQARMINDLLDLSRILSGKMDIVNELVDPAVPLTRVLEHWSATARKQDVTVDASQVRHGEAWVEADPARLEQVYNNLLDNAIRFSPAGGRVEVSTERTDHTWHCEVRDYGMGMGPEELERVFEPFAQGHRQPHSGKGLGLGLAIVHSIVQAFGGRVQAHSDGPGRGCRFTLDLPTHQPPDFVPSSLPQIDEEQPLAGLRILYVEDEVDVAHAMRDGLEHYGAMVKTAYDHAQAVAQLAAIHLDVLVTDLNLGSGPTGLDVIRSVRAMPQHDHVKIIAVSAFGRKEDIAATTAAGAALHLVKPLDVLRLAQAIQLLSREATD